MAVVFPASPAVDDIFVSGTRQYKWNGVAWVSTGSGGGGGASQPGLLGYQNTPAPENYRAIIASNISGDPNQTSNTFDYSTYISYDGVTPPDTFNASSFSSVIASNQSLLSGSYSVTLATQDGGVEFGSYNLVAASTSTGAGSKTISSTGSAIVASHDTTLSNSTNSMIAASLVPTAGLCSHVFVGGSNLDVSYLSQVPSEQVTYASLSAAIAAKESTLGLYNTFGTISLALIHGCRVAGASASRSFNYCNPVINTSGDITLSPSGPDSLVIRETTLFAAPVSGAGSEEMTGYDGLTLHSFLRGSSTTLVPFAYFVEANVFAVHESGIQSAVYKGTIIFRGAGTNTVNQYNETWTTVAQSGAAFDVDTRAFFNTTAIPGQAQLMCQGNETTDVIHFYAHVKIQTCIRLSPV